MKQSDYTKNMNRIVKKFKISRKWALGLMGLGLFIIGFVSSYTLLLIFSPQLPFFQENITSDEIKIIETKESIDWPNTLVIPKINLKEEIFDDGEKSLEKGVWHRKSDQANPTTPGNFILTGHRFNMQWTPNKVVATSPFYHIEKLDPGDAIYVVWDKRIYKYVIEEKFKVKPEGVEIEDQTETQQLTLYTCTLGGRKDGRDVFVARPVPK